MLSISFYFLAIYLTIGNYVFLAKATHRHMMMLVIHILLTVPSSYYLAKTLINANGFRDSFFTILTFTLLLTFFSLLLSGLMVKKIK